VRTFGLTILAVALAVDARAAISRDQEPVVVAGAALPALAGRNVADLGLFKYDAATASFVPIPFQVDERVDHRFNANTATEFEETIYDVLGEDDGLLDDDDEVAFLYGDAGPAAPVSAPWVDGADAMRHEVVVTDPRTGAPVPERRAYLFTGSSLPRSPVSYVAWSGSSTGDVSSSTWSIDFTDRWVLDGYRVFPPCGSGGDLIDRVKGRAGRNLNLESELEWNLSSTFLGGVVGPVRAIRYVRGAASGVNTTHHDVIYPAFWERVVNLRVHVIARIALYIDLLPRAGTSLFTATVPAGVTVDGVPDAGMNDTFVPWALVKGPSGGYVALYDVPASDLYATKLFYYRDDVSYDDAVSPLYDDDDHASFGAQGIDLRDLDNSELESIPFTFRIYPLCGGIGDADLGSAYQGLIDAPLQLAVVPQARVAGPVRTLSLSRDQADVVLDWESIPATTGYRIYAADFSDLPHALWMPLGETTTPGFVDAGAAESAQSRFYSVIGLAGTSEGAW
jgi:hypothetical protein